MELPFQKMHGLGNDFIILDATKSPIPLNATQIRQLSDRHYGIGCDQLVLIKPSNHADVLVEFYNADGSESGACGNATRCVADLTGASTIETKAGILQCRKVGDQIEVNMGRPHSFSKNVEVANEFGLPAAQLVDVGNPHCVFFLEEISLAEAKKIGPQIEHHSLFPNRTNVEFVKVLSATHVEQIIWERGVGITNACGSGACATGYAAYKNGLCGNEVTVQLASGALHIRIDETDTIFMTGPSAHVFSGTIQLL